MMEWLRPDHWERTTLTFLLGSREILIAVDSIWSPLSLPLTLLTPASVW